MPLHLSARARTAIPRLSASAADNLDAALQDIENDPAVGWPAELMDPGQRGYRKGNVWVVYNILSPGDTLIEDVVEITSTVADIIDAEYRIE